LTNERSGTCSVKVARVGFRQPVLYLDITSWSAEFRW
jgi:hypothetical protein